VEELIVESDALTEGLQYGPTAGLAGLVKWLENLQEVKHVRKKDGSWQVSVGSGSQDLINKASNERDELSTSFAVFTDTKCCTPSYSQAFCSLVNPGDSILLESPVYS